MMASMSVSTPAFPVPALLCDIGGTNCRFSILHETGGGPEPLVTVSTDDYPTFEEAFRKAAGQGGVSPASLLVCAAGPMRGRSVRLTNAAWLLEGPVLARTLGLQQGLLLNDFEAQALALPAVQPGWTRAIGAGEADPSRPAIVLGPGTGLGMAGLVQSAGMFLALASEAGHVDFAPATEEDAALWRILRQTHARITPETLLSGKGLSRLHHARLSLAGNTAFDERAIADGDAASITAAALADAATAEADTVRAFWRLVARFAGDFALMLFAKGGVTLAGGILPRIEPLLDEADFRAAFEAKAPMAHVPEAIPVRLLRKPDAVLHGLAAIASHPERYAIDYANRLWIA